MSVLLNWSGTRFRSPTKRPPPPTEFHLPETVKLKPTVTSLPGMFSTTLASITTLLYHITRQVAFSMYMHSFYVHTIVVGSTSGLHIHIHDKQIYDVDSKTWKLDKFENTEVNKINIIVLF